MFFPLMEQYIYSHIHIYIYTSWVPPNHPSHSTEAHGFRMVYPFWKKRIWDISLHVQQIEHCTSRIKMPTTKREIAARNRKNLQFEVYLRHKPLTLGWPGPDLPLFSSSSTIGLIPILAVVFPSFVGFMGNFPLASGSSTSSSICRMANGAFQLVAAAPIFFGTGCGAVWSMRLGQIVKEDKELEFCWNLTPRNHLTCSSYHAA